MFHVLSAAKRWNEHHDSPGESPSATSWRFAGEPNAQSAAMLPLDGKNALPFLLGQEKKSPENIYLFFDGIYLQTARAGRWKIHVQRWNIPRYVGGQNLRANVRLAQPELYDMTCDPGESYNLASQHPEVARELQAKIAEKLRTFPQEIQKANAGLL